MQTETITYSNGTVSSLYYIIHNDSLDLSLIIRDSDRLFGDKGENRMEKHFEEYTRQNGDSIWIWYNSSVKPLYAKGKNDVLSYKGILLPFFLI